MRLSARTGLRRLPAYVVFIYKANQHPTIPVLDHFHLNDKTCKRKTNHGTRSYCLHYFNPNKFHSLPCVFSSFCSTPSLQAGLPGLVAVVTNCGSPVPLTLPSSLCPVWMFVCVCVCVYIYFFRMYTLTNVYIRPSPSFFFLSVGMRVCLFVCVPAYVCVCVPGV